MNTLKGAPRLDVPALFRPTFMAEVEKEHPEYFCDLPPLKPGLAHGLVRKVAQLFGTSH